MKTGRPSIVDTQVPWLGTVPSHWSPMRLRDTVEGCLNGVWGDDPCGDGNDTPVIRVADFDRTNRRTLPHQTVRNVGEEQRRSRELFDGDLLIEKSGGGEQQSVGMVVEYTGPAGAVCSNFVARMRPRDGVHARFLTYMHAHLYSCGVPTLSIKQSTGIQNLDSTAYLGERLHLPPLDEQIAIASYLDAETARIDGLIEGKHTLKDILTELRSATISDAVLGRIDLSSGTRRHKAVGETLHEDAAERDVTTRVIERLGWLKDLPAGWQAKGLRFMLDRNDGGAWGDEPTGSADVIVLRSTEQTVDGRWNITEPAYRSLSRAEHEATCLIEGDLLVTKSSGSETHIGKTTIVDAEVAALRAGYSNFMQRLRATENNHPRFVWYLLNSSHAKIQLNLEATTSTGLANLNGGLLGSLVFPAPPLGEQIAIVSYLDAETARIDDLIAHVDREIDLLQELRSVTITDAVLGRIDVREQMKH